MPHTGLERLNALTRRIYERHINQLVDALEGTYTAAEIDAFFAGGLDPHAEAAITAELASRNLVDATGVLFGKMPRQGADGVEWIDPPGIVAPTLLLPLDGDLDGQDASGEMVATGTGAVRWVEGFDADGGLAVLLEVGATNLNKNPWFAVGISDWSNANATVTRDTSRAYAGPASGLVTPAGTNIHEYVMVFRQLAAATTYTAQVIVYQETGVDQTFALRQGSGAYIIQETVPSGVWTTLTGTVVGNGATTQYRLGLTNTPGAGALLWIGYFGFVEGEDATTPIPAIDASGDILPGYSWAGTPHDSASTREAASLAIPASAFPTVLALRYSDDAGVTWAHVYLTEPGTFGAYGEVTFDTDHLTIAPVTQGFRLGAVRGDDRDLTAPERTELEDAAVWTWTGVHVNYTDLSGYTEQDVFTVEHEVDGTLKNVARANDPRHVFMTITSDQRDHPILTKVRDTPILANADQAAVTMFWPCFVDRRLMGGSGVTLLYSTDHALDADSGIFAAEADSPTATFTARGRVYRDDDLGTQTETPAAIWDAANGVYNVYYQKAGVGLGNQSTLLATTPDLVAFTRIGVVAEKLRADEAGDGHTGYFRPFRVGDGWYAWSLYGGANGYRTLWFSPDGRVWHPHPQKLAGMSTYISHLPGWETGWGMFWHQASVVQWRGRLWAFAPIGMPNTGAGDDEPYRIVTFPLASTLIQPAAPVIDITPAALPWEDGGIAVLGSAFTWDDRLYIPYRGNDAAAGGIGVMEVT